MSWSHNGVSFYYTYNKIVILKIGVIEESFQRMTLVSRFPTLSFNIILDLWISYGFLMIINKDSKNNWIHIDN